MTSYIKGIDVALWEPNIDWAKVRKQDIRFAFIKASQADFTDPKFDLHWAGAKQAGILRGAYHFLDAKVDGKIQAETYLRKVKFEPGDLPPVLDLEELKVDTPQDSKGSKGSKPGKDKDSKGSKGAKGGKPNKVPGLIPNSQIISSAQAWLAKVEAETGRKPIIYSGPFFLRDRVSGPGAKAPQWAMNYMLWIANYLDHEIRENDLPLQPKGWSDWTFWQYSESGMLEGIMNKEGTALTEVDLNFYRGTLEELYALAGAKMPDDSVVVDVPKIDVPQKVDGGEVVIPMDVPTPLSQTTIKHLVTPGDTLGALAFQFHTTVEAIMALNPHITNPDFIMVGDTLTIPQG